MQVIHQLPHPALASYVRCYWQVTHQLAPNETLDVPFGATGRTHVVISLTNTFYMTYGRNERTKIPTGVLFGQATQPTVKHVSGFTRVLVIDFTATGLHALWPVPVDALSNYAHDMAGVVGPEVRTLTEQLLNTPGAAERFAALEAFLLRRLRRVTPATDGRIEGAIRQLQQRPGFISIRQLAGHLNCTERTLNRRFTESVGVSPKLYARVQRFLQTRRWLEQHSRRSWHELPAALGYYDQAHLIHEFHQFTGQSPRLYGADNKPIHDFLRRE